MKRGEQKRADYILYWKPNIPLVIVETKDNNHNIADGMEQALNYAEILDIPFVFTSNGDGFSFYDKTAEHDAQVELTLDQLYFKNATQIGMTATPKETKDTSNIEYFGEPIYTYTLRQGIEDGFLAPYKGCPCGN